MAAADATRSSELWKLGGERILLQLSKNKFTALRIVILKKVKLSRPTSDLVVSHALYSRERLGRRRASRVPSTPTPAEAGRAAAV